MKHLGGKDHKVHNLLSNNFIIKMEIRGRQKGKGKKREKEKESYTAGSRHHRTVHVNGIQFLHDFTVSSVHF